MKHYVYKITNNYNLENNIKPYYYIGVRTSKYCIPEEDIEYMGSSKYLTEDIEKIGITHFKKEILFKFETREEANNKEYNLLTENKANTNKEYYNKAISLNGEVEYINNEGMVSVFDSNGNSKQILKEDFDNNEDYCGVNNGKRYVNNGIENKFILEDDLQSYLDNGWNRGYITNKTLYINNGEKNKKIDPKDLQYYIDNGWIEGKRNWKTHKQYYNNGIETKAFEIDEVPDRWKKGSLVHNSTKDKIVINKDNNIKYILEEELQSYLDSDWSIGNLSRIYINNGNINKQVLEDELQSYLDDGWIKGRLKSGDVNGITGRTKVNKDGICKSVKPDELQSYLDDGWSKGMIKGRIKTIFINNTLENKRVNESEIQSYLDDGWVKGKLKNQCWINNGIENKFIYKKDIQSYLDDGWSKGMIKRNGK